MESLEMNEYEKMSYELIEDKKKVKLDFEKTYIISGIFSYFIIYIFLKVLNCFILLKDREYQLAKEVMLNYEKKKDEETKRNECINIIYKEKEKHERIYGLERYLEDEKRKRKDFINEKNNNIDVSDDK